MDFQSSRLGMLQDEKDLFTDEKNIIHIQVQQRNGRKCITTIYGIDDDLDLHKITKYLKKFYNTTAVGCPSRLWLIVQTADDEACVWT